jgi:hypothetical protein
VVKSYLFTSNRRWRINDVDVSHDKFFLGWWPLLFSLKWWGHFLVRGVWFPSHLLLEGTDHIQGFLGHNRWPTVPGVSYSDSSP